MCRPPSASRLLECASRVVAGFLVGLGRPDLHEPFCRIPRSRKGFQIGRCKSLEVPRALLPEAESFFRSGRNSRGRRSPSQLSFLSRRELRRFSRLRSYARNRRRVRARSACQCRRECFAQGEHRNQESVWRRGSGDSEPILRRSNSDARNSRWRGSGLPSSRFGLNETRTSSPIRQARRRP